MKLLLPLIIIIGNTLIIQGQETEKVKHKISKKEYEIYYVLSSDTSMKHGIYEFYKDKKLRVSGFYKNNKKDSIWTNYQYSGHRISQGTFTNGIKSDLWTYFHENSSKNARAAVGNFSSGSRSGIWKFYNYKDQLIQTFDMNTNNLSEADSIKNKRKEFINEGIYQGLVYTDCRPSYNEGGKTIFTAMASNIVYPEDARLNNIQGKVLISFVVDVNGKISEMKVEKSIHPSLDKEAIHAMKLTNGKWNPAEFEGEKVSYRMIFPINFRIGR